MLSIKLAEQIVQQTKQKLHHNINVISTDGIILASCDYERIDSIHEGAIHVAKTGETVVIDSSNSNKFRNCKPGINLPIYFREQIIGVIGITGKPKQLQEIANLVQLTTEIIVHQGITESKSEWQRKNGDFIFKALIDGTTIPPEIEERIEKLPFKLEPPFQVICIHASAPNTQKALQLQLENITYRQSSFYGQLAINEYYIFLTGDSIRQQQIIQQLQKHFMKLSLRIGISPIVHSTDEIPFAHSCAKKALFHTEQPKITYFEEIELYTLFKASSSIEVSRFIKKLDGLTEKLLHTLHMFFESNLQLTVCAEEMAIHRHTLKYRLNKITEITGYNPLSFEDAFTLKLALSLRKG